MLIRLLSGYHFRRRVPANLQAILGKREIWHSLETIDRSQAKTRACALYALTSDLFFDAGRGQDPEAPDAFSAYTRAIVELKARYRNPSARTMLPRANGYVEVTTEPSMPPETKETASLTSSVDKAALAQLSEQVEALARMVQPKPAKPSPMLSEAAEAFLKRHEKSFKPTALNEHRKSFRRFLEVCGDKPIREYGGEDAGRFKEMLEQLPANYGKNRNDTRTILELVHEANQKNSERISGKAAKNHFTRLSALWRHNKPLGLVDENIFVGGWKFDTTPKIRRVRWSDDDLKTLMGARWSHKVITQATFGFLVGMAAYTGMREEEICRLRPQDITKIKDVWCILVQPHQGNADAPWEEWDPKTEAGSRVVPICQKLLDSGLVQLAEGALRNNQRYLFSELKFSGADKKRASIFQRNFSTFKTRLGIKQEVVFHSFRHNVSTALRNIHENGEGGLRESWIDAFLGHEASHKSTGNMVYFNDVEVKNLKKVADAMVYPEFWDIKQLMKNQ